MSKTLGRHILVEFFGCSPDILNDVITIEKSMVNAAIEAQATVINATFHHFSPYGVSGVVVIQESHLAIHTWPEYGYAAVDLFTCGDEVNPWISYDYLKTAFEADYGSAMEINRGQADLLKRVNIDHLLKERQGTESQLEHKVKFSRNVWFTDKDENLALSLRHTGNLLYRKKSEFQTVQVLESHAFGKMLTIDNLIMTTEKDEFIYHEMITHPAMLSHAAPKNILVIGGGDGGTVRELFRHDSVEKVTMVEIDGNVVEACKEHLPQIAAAFDHPNLDLKIADGIAYVAEAAAESFDIIIVDGSDPAGPAEGLFSEEFYKNVQKALKKDGILVLQSESPHFHQKAFVELNHCLKDIFGAEAVEVYLAQIPTYPTGTWSFTMASKDGQAKLPQLDQAAANAFSEKHGLSYYDGAVHQAAFALPPFVRKMLK
ncbi:polyamine aminopropyltransferase [Saprospira sp. CCB-QB6]|uniref:polyamine aminopropyltransferase n=1 Tax=Saprospira sp. CCB-QB6 TaxID=3023936 RepID=UPI00234BD8C9|nr:polyamine aminopropyltransferase [Saprospira sp. CCB-QB6]WCL81738.1 polyamine aminopropyltransferase [Saprospira sp. CCB-QB6]